MRVPKFAIGDTIYVPWASAYGRIEVPCTICAGKRSVELILGSGEHVCVECSACVNGYNGPTGMQSVFKPTGGVRCGVVTGLNHTDEDGWRYSYGNGSTVKEADVYPSFALAQRVAEDVLLPEAEAQAQRNFESACHDHKKRLSWSAQYHRTALMELRKKVAYHESKLHMMETQRANLAEKELREAHTLMDEYKQRIKSGKIAS